MGADRSDEPRPVHLEPRDREMYHPEHLSADEQWEYRLVTGGTADGPKNAVYR